MHMLRVAMLLAVDLLVQGVMLFAPESAVRLEPKFLPMKEVEERGSHCLDGSGPVYHHKVGKEADKWIIWFMDGTFCATRKDCVQKQKIRKRRNAIDSMPLQLYGEFKDYHHVIIDNCDFGLYMGNETEPVHYKGDVLYFQGARIVKHVIDDLSKAYRMTDVLVAGGSAGGQSLLVGSDYIHSILPASVQRFGVVPINGFSKGDWEHAVKNAYSLHGMGKGDATRCTTENPLTPYVCIKPEVAYKYTRAKSFIVQVFDDRFQYGSHNHLMSAWENCLGFRLAPTKFCTNEGAQNLSQYFFDFVANMTTYPKFRLRGQGGFFSTCAKHNFYKDDRLFNSYTVEGVGVGAAIVKWWQALENANTRNIPQWHLPCLLGHTREELQCETSCSS